jgi:hypothetical protein
VGHLSLLHRLTASAQRIDAAELEEAVEKQSCCKVKDLAAGQEGTVVGRLRAVTYTPTENVPVLEAELWDGSASVLLVWLGRRRIAGIEPGRKVRARGRVGDFQGKQAIYNPWYELQ